MFEKPWGSPQFWASIAVWLAATCYIRSPRSRHDWAVI
jgi:hypothetical protein